MRRDRGKGGAKGRDRGKGGSDREECSSRVLVGEAKEEALGC